ncbi:MAG: hypothetical protein JWM10_3710 [Myxococcaceae bacterium]|nr:hypothetical protein [Myxococcaceae bacterium]
MTAMTTPRAPKNWNTEVYAAHYGPVPLAAGVKLLAGALVFLLVSGYASSVPAAGAVCLGIAEETKDNTLGGAGALSITPARGCPGLVNSGTTDAVTTADLGRAVYAVDDQTIARTSGGGTRCVAGRLVAIEAGVPYVEVGWTPDEQSGAVDEYFLAGADLSGSQYLAVKHSTTVSNTVVVAGAGQMVAGILQNAPASGAVARVRLFGRSKWISSGVVARGAALASDAAGKAKAAVAGTVAGGAGDPAGDPLLGSYATGISLGLGAADVAFDTFINHMGSIPTTAS